MLKTRSGGFFIGSKLGKWQLKKHLAFLSLYYPISVIHFKNNYH